MSFLEAPELCLAAFFSFISIMSIYFQLIGCTFSGLPWFRGLTRITGIAGRKGVRGFVARIPKGGDNNI